MRKALTYAVAVAAASVLMAGCDSSQTASPSSAPSLAPSAPASEPAESSPSVPESPSATASPSAPTGSATPAPSSTGPEKLKAGAKGARVVALQERLTELGYWNGKADGNFGSLTQQAVYALQKAAGIGRDGVVGPKTEAALDKGVRPKAKSDSGYVVEINKKKQLLTLVKDGEVQQIFNTSTGSYEQYEGDDGQTHTAATPDGKFTVSREIDGWRNAPLGMLWRPKYFNGGIAVHGATSVPPYAASHGCARLTVAAMNYLWNGDKIPIDTRVWVY